MAKHRILTRLEASPHIKAGRLVKAYLYEEEHCQDGSEFVLVCLSQSLTQLYRFKPATKLS